MKAADRRAALKVCAQPFEVGVGVGGGGVELPPPHAPAKSAAIMIAAAA